MTNEHALTQWRLENDFKLWLLARGILPTADLLARLQQLLEQIEKGA